MKQNNHIRKLLLAKEWDALFGHLDTEDGRQEARSFPDADGWTLLHGLIENSQDPYFASGATFDSRIQQVLKITQPNVLQAPYGKGKDLPLHLAARQDIDFSLIEHMICAFPEAVEKKNSAGKFPRDLVKQQGKAWNLKVLGSGASLQTLLKFKQWETALEFLPKAEGQKSAKIDGTLQVALDRESPKDLLLQLIESHPEALDKRTPEGDLPIHIAIERSSDVEVVETMIRLSPCSLNKRNGRKEGIRDICRNLRDAEKKEALIALVGKTTPAEWKRKSLEEARTLEQTRRENEDMARQLAELKKRLADAERQLPTEQQSEHQAGQQVEQLKKQNVTLDQARASAVEGCKREKKRQARLSMELGASEAKLISVRESEKNLISLLSGQSSMSTQQKTASMKTIVSNMADRLHKMIMTEVQLSSTAKERLVQLMVRLDDCVTGIDSDKDCKPTHAGHGGGASSPQGREQKRHKVSVTP